MKKVITFFALMSLMFTLKIYSNNPAEIQADEDIYGTWLSTGDNIAPLLQTIFSDNIDSIYATFTADLTYYVRQANKDGTELIYEGVFVKEAGGVGNIYKITIEQSAPAIATVEGIYEINVTLSPDFMMYEVVQTSGTPNVPPTPEAGFGSTNGGAFGSTNVQKYVRLTGGTHVNEDIVGTWISEGANIAPLLQTIFADNIEKIYASFNADQTYNVRQVNKDNTELIYTGVYVQQESSVDYIYTITLEQSSPAVATIEGMYEVDLSVYPHLLQYEVVQTTGTQNLPPTPEAGFGSTNAGAFGTTNVQKYAREDFATTVEDVDILPSEYTLDQNYPNPFNPETKIRFSLPESGNVKLSVYNLIGQEVTTLVDEYLPAGYKEITFNANGLSSGIYFYKLHAENFAQIKKMIILK